MFLESHDGGVFNDRGGGEFLSVSMTGMPLLEPGDIIQFLQPPAKQNGLVKKTMEETQR